MKEEMENYLIQSSNKTTTKTLTSSITDELTCIRIAMNADATVTFLINVFLMIYCEERHVEKSFEFFVKGA